MDKEFNNVSNVYNFAKTHNNVTELAETCAKVLLDTEKDSMRLHRNIFLKKRLVDDLKNIPTTASVKSVIKYKLELIRNTFVVAADVRSVNSDRANAEIDYLNVLTFNLASDLQNLCNIDDTKKKELSDFVDMLAGISSDKLDFFYSNFFCYYDDILKAWDNDTDCYCAINKLVSFILLMT